VSTQRFAPEFKQEGVRQIVDRGYSVAEVSARLGVKGRTLPFANVSPLAVSPAR